jgi:hypothetical protein
VIRFQQTVVGMTAFVRSSDVQGRPGIVHEDN